MDDLEKQYCIFIGSAIRKLRNNKGKSVRLFAYENDIPQATMSRVERGDNNVQLTTLKKIADGFELSMSEFFTKIEADIPKNFKIFEKEHY